MTAPLAFQEGERATWLHRPRGGYGYTVPVSVTVERVGRAKVRVVAPLRSGGERLVWVRPYALRRPS